MGMIREILVFCLFFSFFDLAAQSNYDTVYFSGKQYVEHIVKGGESLKKIAKRYNVTTSDIKKANELDKRLYYNQLLYIPIYLNISNEELIPISELLVKENRCIDTSIINIALLMPYYLIKNDTMFNNYDDTVDVSSIYYTKSEAALSFHIGVELAIDSLRRMGKKIVLYAFDTNKDTLQVRKLVYSNKLDKMDIIIGPMYSKYFQILCRKYGRDSSKVLISPLSRNNSLIKNFPSVFQVAPSYRMQTDNLIDYLVNNRYSERIIVLHDKNEKSLANYAKYRFSNLNKPVEVFRVTYTQVDSIRQFFNQKQSVLLLSKNKAFISKILGSIGSIDSNSVIFAFESLQAYDNLDITNLMEIDVHIPNSRIVNSFNTFFEREYNTNSRSYSIFGYNIIMHFCGDAKIYNFKKSNSGFYENSLAPLYHYVDYDLVPVE